MKNRFSTHGLSRTCNIFARRLLNKERHESDDDFLYEQIQKKYQKAFKCTERINDYLKKVENTSLTKDEQLYLTIHIERVTTE
ncbi:MAG: PRD domain-containing protein [Alkalibacterium sp.]|nr:PRD domain-containing protein [Alkalibacterium sp.]